MRSHGHPWMMPERMIRRQRFRPEYVECSVGDVTRIEERNQVDVDDELAARNVDDVRARGQL